MKFKNKAKYISIMAEYLRQTIKAVDDGVLVLEGNRSFINRISIEIVNKLESL